MPKEREKIEERVMADLRGQGLQSSSAHVCQSALGLALRTAMEGLLDERKRGHALLTLQKLYPASCDLIVRGL